MVMELRLRVGIWIMMESMIERWIPMVTELTVVSWDIGSDESDN